MKVDKTRIMSDKLFSNGDSGDNHEHSDENNETNFREMYVGEGKKYANEDEALKALHFSQEHIARIEEENKRFREESQTREALDDMIDRIVSQVNKTDHGRESNHEGNRPTGEMHGSSNEAEHNRNNMTREEIMEIAKAALQQEQQQSTYNQNIDRCAKTLEEKWGPGYRAVMTNKAKELGVSQEYLLQLAGNSPQMFLAAVGIGSSTNNNGNAAPPRSNVNANFNNQGANKGKDWSYYQKMRRENPTQYFSGEVQREIFERASRGELEIPG